MQRWQHAGYIVVIAILAVTSVLGATGAFTTAQKLLLPPLKRFDSSPELGLVTFEGAWKIEGSYKPIDPTAYKYTCTKKDMTCQAVYVPVRGNVLLIETDALQIESWDDKQITFSDENQCRPTKYVVDLQTEQVSGIAQNAPDPRPKICDGGYEEPKKIMLVNAVGER